ncbi:hypothetical protein NQ314_011569 [Rhamnusium bicolor]|uniref:Major facilitator superfamily (MFS) profile domain-containing protein n=1 Tax=Rhamnusium bicolor TaxID=1586634 RepID=A0AAV8XHT2_9CUCU|nr:hypothetical protein NQ314_011569 [Rhamnusium bicolor]
MFIGWTAPMIPYLISEESHIKTTKHEAECLESAFLIGVFCGLPLTIIFTEKIGRRRSLLFAMFLMSVAWLPMVFAHKIIHIYVCRFLGGVAGNMAFVTAPMYVAEIADQKIRGLLSSFIYLSILTGCLVMYCVGPYLPFYASPLIGGFISLIELAMFYSMPESPYYLLYKDKNIEAKKSLEYFRPNEDVWNEIQEMSDAIKRQKTERGRIKDFVLVKSHRKALLIILIMHAGQHLSGIHVILMNLHLIMREAGAIYLKESTTGIIFSVIMLIASTAASFQVDKYGRKVLLVTSSILSGFCLFTIAVYFNVKYAGYDTLSFSWIPIVAVMSYAASFKIGLGLVPVTITAELFSAKMKSKGMTAAEAMFAIFSLITVQLYLWLANSFGIHVPFYIFSSCTFLLTFFIIYYIPETKGKTLEEIQLILMGHKSNHASKDELKTDPVETSLIIQNVE